MPAPLSSLQLAVEEDEDRNIDLLDLDDGDYPDDDDMIEDYE